MTRNIRPVNAINFLDDLPAFYARYDEDDLFKSFLMQLEEVLEDLRASVCGDALTLTYRGQDEFKADAALAGYQLPVEPFDAGKLGYPKGAQVRIPYNPDTTLLAEPIIAGKEGLNFICVTNKKYLDAKYLKPGDQLIVSSGSGITGLSSINQMPPPNYSHLSGGDKLAYLQYLASWVGLPLRADKLLSWNRRFLREAVALAGNHSTLPGLTSMLKSWHHEEVAAAQTVVTDLTAPENGVNTVFRLGESRVGIDTALGEGAKGHFHVHLTADPNDVSMRDPKKMIALENAAKLMLELEKPAYTDYTLHIHSRTVQLAPDLAIAPYKRVIDKREPESAPEEELLVKDTNTFARVGVTTLLWND